MKIGSRWLEAAPEYLFLTDLYNACLAWMKGRRSFRDGIEGQKLSWMASHWGGDVPVGKLLCSRLSKGSLRVLRDFS